MMPKDCKRLCEVSRHRARLKRIWPGDPGTLHIVRIDLQTENNRQKE